MVIFFSTLHINLECYCPVFVSDMVCSVRHAFMRLKHISLIVKITLSVEIDLIETRCVDFYKYNKVYSDYVKFTHLLYLGYELACRFCLN